jgi:hypothetical protein
VYLLRGAGMRLEKLDIKDFATQHYLDDYLDEHKGDHLPKALQMLQKLQIKLEGNVMTSECFEIALSNEIHRLKHLASEQQAKKHL